MSRRVGQDELGDWLSAIKSDDFAHEPRSWLDQLFPSQIERALFLLIYLVGAFYLVFFKIIAIILVVIVRSGVRRR